MRGGAEQSPNLPERGGRKHRGSGCRGDAGQSEIFTELTPAWLRTMREPPDADRVEPRLGFRIEVVVRVFIGERALSSLPWPLAAAVVLFGAGAAGLVRTIDTPGYSQLVIPAVARRHASLQPPETVGPPELVALSAEALVVSASFDLPPTILPSPAREALPRVEAGVHVKVPSAPSDAGSPPPTAPQPEVRVQPLPEEQPILVEVSVASAAAGPPPPTEAGPSSSGPAVTAAGLPGTTGVTPLPELTETDGPGKSELAPGRNKGADGKPENGRGDGLKHPRQSPSSQVKSD